MDKKRISMIIISAFVLLLGIFTFIAMSIGYKQLKNNNIQKDPNIQNIENNANNEQVNNTLQGVKEENVINVTEKTSENDVKVNTITVTEADTILPCNGEITTDFSMDALVFSKTMGDWRIHTGIDIKGEMGENIKAIKSGTVQDVYYDEMMGYTVSIKHIDGAISVYSNLENSISVSAGDKVSVGDIIGQIGTSAMLEGEEQPHLHLEVIKDEIHINPLEYISE